MIDKDEKVESALSDDEKTKLKELFEATIDNKSMTFNVESLAPDELPVIITLPEFMRRMKDMSQLGGGGMMMMGNMPDQFSVAINANHKLIQKVIQTGTEDAQKQLAKQAFDLALLSQNMLQGPDLTSFIQRSLEIAES